MAVKLDLTGDFLTPAAACIKPVPTTRRKPMKLSDTEPPDILATPRGMGG